MALPTCRVIQLRFVPEMRCPNARKLQNKTFPISQQVGCTYISASLNRSKAVIYRRLKTCAQLPYYSCSSPDFEIEGTNPSVLRPLPFSKFFSRVHSPVVFCHNDLQVQRTQRSHEGGKKGSRGLRGLHRPQINPNEREQLSASFFWVKYCGTLTRCGRMRLIWDNNVLIPYYTRHSLPLDLPSPLLQSVMYRVSHDPHIRRYHALDRVGRFWSNFTLHCFYYRNSPSRNISLVTQQKIVFEVMARPVCVLYDAPMAVSL